MIAPHYHIVAAGRVSNLFPAPLHRFDPTTFSTQNVTNLRKCVWRLRKWLQGAQCRQWNGLLENSSSGTRAIQRNTAVRSYTVNGCAPALFTPMLLALWLTNPGHQSRSFNILSWFVHTHSGCYFTRMFRILYSGVSRSSELTAENLSRRIQRPGTCLCS